MHLVPLFRLFGRPGAGSADPDGDAHVDHFFRHGLLGLFLGLFCRLLCRRLRCLSGLARVQRRRQSGHPKALEQLSSTDLVRHMFPPIGIAITWIDLTMVETPFTQGPTHIALDIRLNLAAASLAHGRTSDKPERSRIRPPFQCAHPTPSGFARHSSPPHPPTADRLSLDPRQSNALHKIPLRRKKEDDERRSGQHRGRHEQVLQGQSP